MANTNLVPKLANLEHETALTNTDLFMIESSSGEKKYTTIDDLAIS
jgi:hypothetical protein